MLIVFGVVISFPLFVWKMYRFLRSRRGDQGDQVGLGGGRGEGGCFGLNSRRGDPFVEPDPVSFVCRQGSCILFSCAQPSRLNPQAA